MQDLCGEGFCCQTYPFRTAQPASGNDCGSDPNRRGLIVMDKDDSVFVPPCLNALWGISIGRVNICCPCFSCYVLPFILCESVPMSVFCCLGYKCSCITPTERKSENVPTDIANYGHDSDGNINSVSYSSGTRTTNWNHFTRKGTPEDNNKESV
jgi:hypothetical protein